jgi:SAM-dependent methyltransferase
VDPDTQRQRLRATFDEDPSLYDSARPSYPAQLFDDLVELASLPASPRVVEIGCGTGQATTPLAELGWRVTCVELGERVAEVARRNLVRFPQVEVVTADYETWQPGRGEFDAVVAFTSFHWIAPEIRYVKAPSLLHDRGVLAIVTTDHVLQPDGDAFFAEVQQDYEAVLPEAPASRAGGPKPADAIPDMSADVNASGRFRIVANRRYLWDVTYSADEYIDVLRTYSNHRDLDEDTRERLLGRIRRRVDARPGGQVRKTYLAMLNVAARLPAPDEPASTMG